MVITKNHVRWAKRVCIVSVIFAVITTIPFACETGPKGPYDDPTIVASVYMETDAMIMSMQHEVAMMEAKAVNSPLSPDEAAALARSKAQLAGMQRLLDRSRSDAAAAGRQPDMGDVAKGLTSYLPAPISIPLGIVVGGISEWYRSRKKRVSFGRLVNALDTVKSKDPAFARAMDAAGPAIKSELGSSARAVVDKMRSNGTGS